MCRIWKIHKVRGGTRMCRGTNILILEHQNQKVLSIDDRSRSRDLYVLYKGTKITKKTHKQKDTH